MLIIGCDYHPGFQQIAFVDTETGEFGERRVTHREEAEQFYRALKERSVRVGMEASGHARWFERLLAELHFELWIGDAEIRQTSAQAEDGSTGCAVVAAAHGRRPVPADLGSGRREPGSAATAVASAPVSADAHAGDESVACGSAQRRSAAQESLMAAGGSQATGVVDPGTMGEAATPGPARLIRPTHAEDPGTDPSAGRGSREATGDAAADDASRRGPADGTGLRVGHWNSPTLSWRQADRQLCGAGSVGRIQRRSPPTRTHQQTGQLPAALLLVEAAQVTVRSHPLWRSKFFHLALRRGRKIAKVAMARKLAVHLYWMWRQGWDYGQFEKLGSHAGAPGNRHGGE